VLEKGSKKESRAAQDVFHQTLQIFFTPFFVLRNRQDLRRHISPTSMQKPSSPPMCSLRAMRCLFLYHSCPDSLNACMHSVESSVDFDFELHTHSEEKNKTKLGRNAHFEWPTTRSEGFTLHGKRKAHDEGE